MNDPTQPYRQPSVNELVELVAALEDDATQRHKLEQGHELYSAAVAAGLLGLQVSQDTFASIVGEAVRRGLMDTRNTSAGAFLAAPGNIWSTRDLQGRFGYHLTVSGQQLATTLQARRGALSSAPVAEPPPPAGPAAIFLVHGRDHGLRETVARFLEKAGSSDVLILDEQAGKGRTLVEKFEQHASAANYAVVLLTADDIGGPADTKEMLDLQKRARQNVVFELGFFWGKIGRDRVAVLLDTGVEKPSDIDGLNYILIDEAGGWKARLVKELVAADLDFDAARA